MLSDFTLKSLDYLGRWADFRDLFCKLCTWLDHDRPLDTDSMLRLLNLLNVDVNGNHYFWEICDLNEILPLLKEKLDQVFHDQVILSTKYGIRSIILLISWLVLLSNTRHLGCSKLFDMFCP